ncbi:PE family protein [Mycobacterium sp. Marseille-P9652]|uniref:PE family protein n=1 Tax=Mycobacterium sp. Marseille-P9652 TaxID=2654950 RepID=UPI0012E7AF73|nr:PE family protein [Mycobacterium sp. Marseille-P9652]
MSAVIATPELIAQAATDVASIGSTVNAAHMVAAAPTVSVLPAGADEVSAGIAHLFSGYAQDFQALAGKAAAFQDQFVQHLTASAGAYASAEDAIASLLQGLNANPWVAAFIHPDNFPLDSPYLLPVALVQALIFIPLIVAFIVAFILLSVPVFLISLPFTPIVWLFIYYLFTTGQLHW